MEREKNRMIAVEAMEEAAKLTEDGGVVNFKKAIRTIRNAKAIIENSLPNRDAVSIDIFRFYFYPRLVQEMEVWLVGRAKRFGMQDVLLNFDLHDLQRADTEHPVKDDRQFDNRREFNTFNTPAPSLYHG